MVDQETALSGSGTDCKLVTPFLHICTCQLSLISKRSSNLPTVPLAGDQVFKHMRGTFLIQTTAASVVEESIFILMSMLSDRPS